MMSGICSGKVNRLMGLGGFKAARVIPLAVVLLASEFVWSQTALALDPKKAITQYVHDVWRMEDGLPSNNVSAILQTRDGWVGADLYSSRMGNSSLESLPLR